MGSVAACHFHREIEMKFSTAPTIDIIAPGLIAETWTEAEVLGSAVWLWMHGKSHRNLPLHTLPVLLLPAIKYKQFILASENGRPIFYISWANMSLEAEGRYLRQHPVMMREADWISGDRMWFLDWVAPFGHTRIMHGLLLQHLFANRLARFLYHRGYETGAKIKHFKGRAVPPGEAKQWLATHPPAHIFKG